MTGYTITLGYNASNDIEEAGKELLRIVAQLRTQSQVILNEVREYDPGMFNLGENVEDYAAAYAAGEDLTLVVQTGNTVVEREGIAIRQSASGSGPSRVIKEAFRRAFCRLVIQAMHRHGYEVNLNVH